MMPASFPMSSLFSAAALCLLLLSSHCRAHFTRNHHPLRHEGVRLPPLPRLSHSYENYRQRGVNGSACVEAPPAQIGAPKKNVWAQLGYEEVVEVRKFLFNQKELNLSSEYGYFLNGDTGGHTLGKIELNVPNKTDVLPYLDGNGPEPLRYAKTQINYYGEDFARVQEIIVGPIPVDATTTWEPLGYPYSRKSGSITEYYHPYHFHAADEFAKSIKKGAKDIFAGVWPHLNGSWDFYASASVPRINGNLAYWYTSWTGAHTDGYGVGSAWPLGMYFGVEIPQNDPKNPGFLGWIYNDTLYATTDDLRDAYKSGIITSAPATVAGKWDKGGHHGDVLPMDVMAPPQAVAPAGSRFSLDMEAKYVQWMGFSFYMAFTTTRGWAFYDIRHKGQRILYELSLQEALAHYAGNDPSESTTWFRDASIGLGSAIVELVPGYDCPAYARHMTTHASYGNEKGTLKKNSICFFEFDADYPIARHTGSSVTSRKNIYFVVRSIYTVGNYDYMFSYEFYLDGSIKISVRASGYIIGQSAVGNKEYGYDIHQGYSGGMHDHTLNFKADFDILGTANTMQLTSFVPANTKYLWSEQPRETLKLKREFVESEDKSRLNWDRATQYTVVNTDKPNKWGEYRGYRILPADGTTHFTNQKSSNAKNLIHPFTFDLGVTKFKDTEPQSTNENDSFDYENPMINFDDFFNGESLMQEDLVVWFNLGMHHLPHTGDLPLTLFTTAHASVVFQPLNYFYSEISTESLSQVEIDFTYARGNYTVGKVKTFGQNQAFCSIDLSKDAPDLYEADNYY